MRQKDKDESLLCCVLYTNLQAAFDSLHYTDLFACLLTVQAKRPKGKQQSLKIRFGVTSTQKIKSPNEVPLLAASKDVGQN